MNFFSTFIIIWILVALVTFIYLFYVDAPYGRHIRTGWGKNISARVGWVVMESPCVILLIIYAWLVKDQLQIVHIVFCLKVTVIFCSILLFHILYIEDLLKLIFKSLYKQIEFAYKILNLNF